MVRGARGVPASSRFFFCCFFGVFHFYVCFVFRFVFRFVFLLFFVFWVLPGPLIVGKMSAIFASFARLSAKTKPHIAVFASFARLSAKTQAQKKSVGFVYNCSLHPLPRLPHRFSYMDII